MVMSRPVLGLVPSATQAEEEPPDLTLNLAMMIDWFMRKRNPTAASVPRMVGGIPTLRTGYVGWQKPRLGLLKIRGNRSIQAWANTTQGDSRLTAQPVQFLHRSSKDCRGDAPSPYLHPRSDLALDGQALRYASSGFVHQATSMSDYPCIGKIRAGNGC